MYFPGNFAAYGDMISISKSLECLNNEGIIIRLANGICLYPKFDQEFGLGVLYPTIEIIVLEFAWRENPASLCHPLQNAAVQVDYYDVALMPMHKKPQYLWRTHILRFEITNTYFRIICRKRHQ